MSRYDNDKGIFISNIVHTMLHTPKRTFTLYSVLHVPHITKPLLSVKNFYCDNNLYFEFHASVFYVKDLTTKAVLLSSQNNDGLYVLSESFYHVNPLGLLVVAQVRRCNDRPLGYLEIKK